MITPPRFFHPARFFILYLLSRRSISPHSIVATLLELGLPVPSAALGEGQLSPDLLLARIREEEKMTDEQKERRAQFREENFPGPYSKFADDIGVLQRNISFPPRYDPMDRTNVQTQQWLSAMRIADYWRKDEAVMAAYDYLHDPQICRAIQVCLLGPLSYHSISRRIADRYHLTSRAMNPRIVRAFSHYFWNFNNLNRAQWERTLMHDMPGETTDMIMALRSPRSSVGAAITLYMSDQGCSEMVREVIIYKFCRDTSFVEFGREAIQMRTGVHKAQAMLMSIDGMIKAQERMDQYQGGSADLLEELRRIEANFDQRNITTIHDLPLDHLPPEQVIDVPFEEVKKKNDSD